MTPEQFAKRNLETLAQLRESLKQTYNLFASQINQTLETYTAQYYAESPQSLTPRSRDAAKKLRDLNQFDVRGLMTGWERRQFLPGMLARLETDNPKFSTREINKIQELWFKFCKSKRP